MLPAASQLIFAHEMALPSCLPGSRFSCKHEICCEEGTSELLRHTPDVVFIYMKQTGYRSKGRPYYEKIVWTLCLIWLGIFGCAGILLFTGCSWKQEKPEKTNLAFTVVDEARLPEELLKLVTEKKEASFKMTYADSGYLYLCVGYGKQDSGGYSITVDDLYASGEMIYLDTSLIGPKQAKELGETPSYPYIVIKTPFEDKTVVFD